MKNINYFLLLFNLTFIQFSFARPNIAKVIKIRGQVTQLQLGERFARKLRVGDLLKEKTSILSNKHSFVRIMFIKDHSQLNLGPNSKIIIASSTKTKPTLITLLKGQIRAKINRNLNNHKHKFFVKTRVAALGVRGTEFQTIYNPENKRTSLITYKGEVAMVKTNVKNKELEKSNIKNNIQEKQLSAKSIDKLLSHESVVVVKQGQFSGTFQGAKKVSQPVIINPKQMNALYYNKDLVIVTDANVKSSDLSKINSSELRLVASKQKAPAEGFSNQMTGEFAPKAGGVIDLNTGIYIPPTRESLFDPKLGVYVDNKIGTIDKTTGQYIAPAGLKLDSTKGFVLSKQLVASSNHNKNVSNSLMALRSNLNKTIIPVKKGISKQYMMAITENAKVNYYNDYELMQKNLISLSMIGKSYTIGDSREISSNRQQVDSTMTPNFILEWTQTQMFNLQPIIKFGISTLSYDTKQNLHNNEQYIELFAGLKKVYSEKSSIIFYGQFIQQGLISNVKSGSSYKESLEKANFSKAGFIFKYKLLNNSRYSFNTDFGLFGQLKAQANEVKVGTGLGITGDLYFKMWWSKNISIQFGGHFTGWKADLNKKNNSGVEYTEKRMTFGEHGPFVKFSFVI